MAKNSKKEKTTLNSFDDVDDALLELGKEKVFVQNKEAEMNGRIQTVREAFDLETADSIRKITGLEVDIETFCIANKFEFERVRSKELTHGIVSFRTTPPKVAMLNRKYNVNTVLELLKKIHLTMFIRTKDELDKDAVLAASAAKEISDEKLAAVGLKIDQSEQFSVEIKWDSLNA